MCGIFGVHIMRLLGRSYDADLVELDVVSIPMWSDRDVVTFVWLSCSCVHSTGLVAATVPQVLQGVFMSLCGSDGCEGSLALWRGR